LLFSVQANIATSHVAEHSVWAFCGPKKETFKGDALSSVVARWRQAVLVYFTWPTKGPVDHQVS